jgi:uncharacterized protein YcnI
MNHSAKATLTALAALLLLASGAAAHVGLERTEAPVGAGYKAVFKVPHGCEGSATTEVTIDIPEGIIAVKPMPKAGWTIELVKKPYARTYAFYHGAKLSEGVTQVIWRGGPLPDAYYDEFVLSTFIARELKPGPIYFPVTQKCETGEMAWREIPAEGQDPHDLEHPAPRLTLVARPGESDHATRITAGDLVIAAPWSSATPAGARNAAGYLKISNTGREPDVLLGATTSVAERAETHETTTDAAGVSKMRELVNGIEIKAGETVELKPLGRHLMLLALKTPLMSGATYKATLTFKRAGAVEVPFAVRPIGSAPPHGH